MLVLAGVNTRDDVLGSYPVRRTSRLTDKHTSENAESAPGTCEAREKLSQIRKNFFFGYVGYYVAVITASVTSVTVTRVRGRSRVSTCTRVEGDARVRAAPAAA